MAVTYNQLLNDLLRCTTEFAEIIAQGAQKITVEQSAELMYIVKDLVAKGALVSRDLKDAPEEASSGESESGSEGSEE